MPSRARGSASRSHASNSLATLGETAVDTDCARAEARDLKQTARQHDVLEEVDHLILVGKVAVERYRSHQCEKCQHDCHQASLEACDQQEPAAEFNGNGYHEG